MRHLYSVFCGLIFGIANIIPGVSGGTMLVVFNCYDKVCGALSLNVKEIKKNIIFLLFFGIGAAGGILGFSYVITYLFDNFPIQTNMFFIGLILGSVPLIVKNARRGGKIRAWCVVPLVLALSLVVGLTVLQNTVNTDPYTLKQETANGVTTVTLTNNNVQTINNWYITVENADDLGAPKCKGVTLRFRTGTIEKIKQLFGVEAATPADTFYPIDELKTIPSGGSVSFTYTEEAFSLKPSLTYAMNASLFFMLLGGGAIAAIAMIIPGVSGSFVMMLLGLYTTIIGAVRSLDFVILIPAAVGIIIGLVIGARLISWLLKKYSLAVYSVIMGFVIGSVYAILPAGFGLNAATGFGLIALLLGGALAVFVGKIGGDEKAACDEKK